MQQQNTSVFISCSLTVKNMIKIDSSWRPCKPRSSFFLLVLFVFFVFFFANVANVVTPPPLPPLWTVQEFQTHSQPSNWILTCATHNLSPLKSHSVMSSLQLLGSYPCHMILNLRTRAHYPSRCPTVWACFEHAHTCHRIIIIFVAMLEAWGSFEHPHHFCIARSTKPVIKNVFGPKTIIKIMLCPAFLAARVSGLFSKYRLTFKSGNFPIAAVPMNLFISNLTLLCIMHYVNRGYFRDITAG